MSEQEKSLKGMIGEDLIKAANCGEIKDARNLLSNGADVNYRAVYTKSTPLISAAAGGHQRFVEFLLDDHKASLDLNAHDQHGWTALHFASDGLHQGIVAALIKAGAGLNYQNEMGQTPLDRAERKGETLTSIILREAGAERSKQEVLPPKKMPTAEEQQIADLEARVLYAETVAADLQSRIIALDSRVAVLEARV